MVPTGEKWYPKYTPFINRSHPIYRGLFYLWNHPTLRTLGPWNDERCVQNVRPKRVLEKRIREMYLCYMYVLHMYWLVVMCKNPLALYLILGKRIGDSVSGGIGDSVSVFSSMAALFAWQLPVFDRGKSHVKRCSAAPEHLHLHRPMERQTPNWNRSCLSLKRNLNLFPRHTHLAQLAELVV